MTTTKAISNVRPFSQKTPSLGERVYIDPSAVVIGNVSLGEDVSVWPTAVLRGDVNRISVGARSNVQDGSVLHVTHDGPFSPGGVELNIGEDVTVGHAAMLHACTIGNRCLIGINAIVMDRACIDDDVLVAAGSLVTPDRKLESGGLYAGRPAKRVRDLTDDEMEMLQYSAGHYVRLKDKYLTSKES